MLSVQPFQLCERDPHSKRVVAVSAIKREKDDRGSYFPAVFLGRAFDRIASANAVYGLASIFCHMESPSPERHDNEGDR